MKKRMISVTLTGVLLLGACGNAEEERVQQEGAIKQNSPTEVEVTEATDEEIFAQVKAVVEKNIAAGEAEDIAAYMDTLYGPNLDQVKASMIQMFDNFDLDIEVSNLKLESISEDKSIVKVTVTQKTVEVNGSEDFRDNEIFATHTLQNINGEYKIVSSVADETTIKYLEE